jgi:hypothetical protein
MRRVLALVLVLTLPLLLAGCGDRSLIVNVDILSFLDAGERATTYNVPGGIAAINVDIASQGVNLLPGIEDATDVLTASLDVEASLDHREGTGSGMLLLFLAPGDSTSPFTTEPLDTIPVNLTPNSVVNVSDRIDSHRLADALVRKNAIVGIRATFDTRATAPTDSLTGTLTITKLYATVTAKRNL